MHAVAAERWKTEGNVLHDLGRAPDRVHDLRLPDASDMPPFAEPFLSGQDAGLEPPSGVMNTELHKGLSRSADADQTDRCLSQSSAACATSRQPWSIVSEWPRSGNSTKSVMAGDLW